MSWMQKLYETYEAGMKLDLPDTDRLMPISHTLQNAHIKITIDPTGNFKRAEIMSKTQIVLPATEQSAGRTAGEAPHPLADKLQYIAKDYPLHGGVKPSYFESYLAQLEEWCESSSAHPKAVAIKSYAAKGTVVEDLVKNGLLVVDDDGNLLCPTTEDLKNYCDKKKIDKPKIFSVISKDNETKRFYQGNALVCWSVETPGDLANETWTDQALQQSWIDFELSHNSDIALCYVTGKPLPFAVNHPAKLRHTGDKAKLISSNDMSGYTFRGRFTDTKKSIEKHGAQSVGIGFEVTQKAHNALRWLISRQGFRNDDQVIVAWAVSGNDIPQPMEDTYSLLDMDIDEPKSSSPIAEPSIDHTVNLGHSFATELAKYMAGYNAKLAKTDNIVIMGLGSATSGRMGVTYYQELFPKDYIDQVSRWHSDFAWYQRYKKETKPIWPISAPSSRAIVESLYNHIIGDETKNKLKKNAIERILPSIIEGSPFPRDLVKNAVYRASNRSAQRLSDKFSNFRSEIAAWEKHLGIACALYRGYCKRDPNQPKEYEMALEESNHSRDYLYGRLLAIAERIEEMAMVVANEKPRTTHASRLMQRFSDQPFSTWKTIEEGINPYQQRLKNNIAPLESAYKRLLDEVCFNFEGNDFINKEKLSGEYLLSYHLQRKWLRDHKLYKGQWVLREAGESDDLPLDEADA